MAQERCNFSPYLGVSIEKHRVEDHRVARRNLTIPQNLKLCDPQRTRISNQRRHVMADGLLRIGPELRESYLLLFIKHWLCSKRVSQGDLGNSPQGHLSVTEYPKDCSIILKNSLAKHRDRMAVSIAAMPIVDRGGWREPAGPMGNRTKARGIDFQPVRLQRQKGR